RNPEDEHWWFASRTWALLGMLDRCVTTDDRRVLDAGCGAGNMIHHLARYGPVVGLDNNYKPLMVARGRGYDVSQGSGEAVPFPDGAFDIVAALDTIEHIEDEDAVLRECARAIRPGGLLVLTGPAFMFLWSQNDEVNHHYRRYTVGELKKKLARHGFRVRRAGYNNFFLFPLAAALILLRRWSGKAPELAAPDTDKDAYQVEMEPASPLMNTVLSVVGRVEAAILRHVGLPWGTGFLLIAEKAA
ncbi:MAG: class I SAM-dependent methyltransferase, partial [Chloroflexi bacterium]|nr:class I SAM-dependent methyltransferase [Chloroflexota bacterium]